MFQMPDSIICFTKVFTLRAAPFMFILVGVMCEFAMVPGVYMFCIVPSGKRGALFFLRAQMYTFSSTFIKEI